MAINPYQPNRPKNFPIRPLTKGMFPDLVDPEIPSGGLQDLVGFIVRLYGLQSRYGLADAGISIPSSDSPIRGLIFFKARQAVRTELLIIGQKNIYVYTESSGASTPIYLTWNAGTVECPATVVVTGTNTQWLTEGHIKSGDTIIFDPSGTAEEVTISSVDSDTQITLENAPSNSYSSGTSYEIHSKLTGDIDFAVCPDFVAFADGIHPPYKYTYEASELDFISDSTKDWIASTTTYAFDRLWFGDLIEESNGYHYKQRIRWSSALDLTKFTDDTEGDVQWLDIPYTHSPIMKLLPLGNLLVAYFKDTIFLGHRTNVTGNLLPYAFSESIDTGKRGLVNRHAVVDWLDSHFFISQDNIYQLSINQPMKPIASQIANHVIRNVAHPEVFKIFSDPLQNRLVMLAPDSSSSSVSDIYTYDLETSSWSHFNDTWHYFETNTFSLTNDSLLDYIAINEKIYTLSSTTSSNSSKVIQTPSLDFNMPDTMKTATRLSIKLMSAPSTNISFTISGSTDKGNSWKTLGTLIIPSGKLENYINFRITGSAITFKIESTTNTLPIVIQEIVVRVYGRNLEDHIRA